MNRKLYLVAYDIRSPRRMRLALYLLKGFASGRQKSVFECFLTSAERGELIDTMSAIIDPDEDRFLLLPIANTEGIMALGKGVAPANPCYYYVG